MIKNAPKRIYLQVGEDLPKNENVNFKDLNGVTWCEDKINDSDICYIRAGKYYTPSVLVEEEKREPIENALYATGKFTTSQATELAQGILQYIKEAGYTIVRTDR